MPVSRSSSSGGPIGTGDEVIYFPATSPPTATPTTPTTGSITRTTTTQMDPRYSTDTSDPNMKYEDWVAKNERIIRERAEAYEAQTGRAEKTASRIQRPGAYIKPTTSRLKQYRYNVESKNIIGAYEAGAKAIDTREFAAAQSSKPIFKEGETTDTSKNIYGTYEDFTKALNTWTTTYNSVLGRGEQRYNDTQKELTEIQNTLKNVDERQYNEAKSARPSYSFNNPNPTSNIYGDYDSYSKAVVEWVTKYGNVLGREVRYEQTQADLAAEQEKLKGYNLQEYQYAIGQAPSKIMTLTDSNAYNEKMNEWASKYGNILGRADNYEKANKFLEGKTELAADEKAKAESVLQEYSKFNFANQNLGFLAGTDLKKYYVSTTNTSGPSGNRTSSSATYGTEFIPSGLYEKLNPETGLVEIRNRQVEMITTGRGNVVPKVLSDDLLKTVDIKSGQKVSDFVELVPEDKGQKSKLIYNYRTDTWEKYDPSKRYGDRTNQYVYAGEFNPKKSRSLGLGSGFATKEDYTDIKPAYYKLKDNVQITQTESAPLSKEAQEYVIGKLIEEGKWKPAVDINAAVKEQALQQSRLEVKTNIANYYAKKEAEKKGTTAILITPEDIKKYAKEKDKYGNYINPVSGPAVKLTTAQNIRMLPSYKLEDKTVNLPQSTAYPTQTQSDIFKGLNVKPVKVINLPQSTKYTKSDVFDISKIKSPQSSQYTSLGSNIPLPTSTTKMPSMNQSSFDMKSSYGFSQRTPMNFNFSMAPKNPNIPRYSTNKEKVKGDFTYKGVPLNLQNAPTEATKTIYPSTSDISEDKVVTKLMYLTNVKSNDMEKKYIPINDSNLPFKSAAGIYDISTGKITLNPTADESVKAHELWHKYDYENVSTGITPDKQKNIIPIYMDIKKDLGIDNKYYNWASRKLNEPGYEKDMTKIANAVSNKYNISVESARDIISTAIIEQNTLRLRDSKGNSMAPDRPNYINSEKSFDSPASKIRVMNDPFIVDTVFSFNPVKNTRNYINYRNRPQEKTSWEIEKFSQDPIAYRQQYPGNYNKIVKVLQMDRFNTTNVARYGIYPNSDTGSRNRKVLIKHTNILNKFKGRGI